MTKKKLRVLQKVASPTGIGGLKTGVPGLDAIIGNGLPELSFNLIAGDPGSGKTTLAQQIVFANATVERPALYFTVLGEPTLKMVRYQREFSFFDSALVGTAVQFINLSAEALARDLTVVLDRIVSEVERVHPGIVIVDSFRTFVAPGRLADELSIDDFIQRLALHLTTWEATSFLIGEYAEREQRNPVFTVADGVFWLSQSVDRNSVVRKIQAIKVRGRAQMPGLHTFRITGDGLQIFPRIPDQQFARRPQATYRLGTGVPGLDEVMGGGIPAGDAVMLAGPAGSGKTTFATQFAAEGLRQGEAVVIVVFEEYPEEYLARAEARDQNLEDSIKDGKLELIYLRPLDLSVDETLAEILEAVERIAATRVVIDSLSGFEVALAPGFREDFRESLYRLVGALTATGVTIFMTTEVVGGHPDVHFTSERVSFITDDIIVQRVVEVDGELRSVIAVHKMRGSEHSRDFRSYDITSAGAVVGGPLKHFRGIMTGLPELRPRLGRCPAGLDERESALLETLVRLGEVPADVLAARTAMPGVELLEALRRLEALGYASSSGDKHRVYRAVAQPHR